jgi:hypothetical protein
MEAATGQGHRRQGNVEALAFDETADLGLLQGGPLLLERRLQLLLEGVCGGAGSPAVGHIGDVREGAEDLRKPAFAPEELNTPVFQFREIRGGGQ